QAGIVHLVAISGLHIGLLAAAGFWLGRFLWRMLLWRSGISRRVFATLIAAVFALLYTALAGFSLPTVRALLMLLIVAAALLSRRSVQPLNTLLLTLLLVLLLDPFAPLSAGFWLSFFAVAVILSIIRYRQGFVARLSQLLQLQLLLGLSMLPLVAITVGSASPWGMLVNLLAIPYFSLLVVPSVLLGTLFLWISESLGNALLHFSAQSAAFILQALQSLPLQVGLLNNIHRPLLLTLLALLGMSAILLPRLWPGRYALLLLTLPWLLYRPPVLEDDVLQVAFIDVGQGLSVLLRAADETLLYDTGSAWPGSSAAERNILPLLEAWGIDELQTLVASHGDKDHAGGVPELMRHFPQAELISGEPARLRHHARPCVQGQQWQLGRAQVRVLSPASSPSRGDQSGNDNSCVLLVELGKARVLLTGDISSRLEKKLLAQSISLHSTLVSVAHHGSRYSSSAAFARTVQPQYAVVSAGYLNRYHFPTRQAVDHWQAAGAEVLNTSKTGLLNFFLSADGQIHYQAYRQSARRFWFAD
ncbi:MAG: DNA internalization-related competence protein ComEC/Rec2, partial [gamma proteobacterium symbiont of Bathyaustriella thionipta]|nr:DNA internalization-related competence protein ComEC/Rec2 [gamma proteobacterium symbiont of Bathyaustriella thionipta]